MIKTSLEVKSKVGWSLNGPKAIAGLWARQRGCCVCLVWCTAYGHTLHGGYWWALWTLTELQEYCQPILQNKQENEGTWQPTWLWDMLTKIRGLCPVELLAPLCFILTLKQWNVPSFSCFFCRISSLNTCNSMCLAVFYLDWKNFIKHYEHYDSNQE